MQKGRDEKSVSEVRKTLSKRFCGPAAIRLLWAERRPPTARPKHRFVTVFGILLAKMLESNQTENFSILFYTIPKAPTSRYMLAPEDDEWVIFSVILMEVVDAVDGRFVCILALDATDAASLTRLPTRDRQEHR